MRLDRLVVKNVRSFEEADLPLDDGITLLVGDVGADKTSLLYAIEMALFGFAEVDAGYLVRRGSRDAEVTLGLVDDDHRYELRRSFRRRSVRGRSSYSLESSALSEDGATQSYSATELRRRAIDLLGFPDNPNPNAHSDLWRWAVYVPQEQMRAVLDDDPSSRAARQETIRKAIGLEQYRLAADNAQSVATELGRRSRRWDEEAAALAHHSDDLDRWSDVGRSAAVESTARRSEVEEQSKLLAVLDDELRRRERAEAELAQARARAAEADERASRTRATVDRVRSLRDEVGRRTEAIGADLASRPAVAEALAHAETRLLASREERSAAAEALEGRRDAVALLLGIESRRVELRRSRTTLESDLVQRRSSLAALQAELAAAEADGPKRAPTAPTPRTLAELSAIAADAQRTVVECTAALSRQELEISEIDGLLSDGICPRCHQPVRPDEFGAHRREAADRRDEAASRLVTATSTRDAVEEERRSRDRFERAWIAWERVDERRSDLRRRTSDADEAVASLVARTVELEASLQQVDVQLASLDEARRAVDDARERLASADDALRRAEDERLRRVRESDRLAQVELERARLSAESERLALDVVAAERESAEAVDRAAIAHATVAATLAEVGVAGALEERRSERRRIALRIEAAHRALGQAEVTVRHAEEETTKARAGLDRRQALLAQSRRERAIGAWLSRGFRETVQMLEQRLLARARSELDAALGSYFLALIDDPSMIARCDSTFAPAVEVGTEWTPPAALSGGERTALALAYRLAVGRVVRGLGDLRLETLILDEPTDGFSPDQVARVGEIVRDLGVTQVLLVSHESSLAGVADHVVRVRKVDGLSSVTLDDRSAPRTVPGPVRGTSPRPRSPRRRTLDVSAPPAPSPPAA